MNLFTLWKEITNPTKINSVEISDTEDIPNEAKTVAISIHEADKGAYNVINPLLNLSETDLRDLCRHHLDTFENWSRRIIHETFKENYGSDYFNNIQQSGNPLIKSEIKRRIEQRVSDNPGRYPRMIDAILLEDIEYFLCREDFYNSYFKVVLEPFFSGPLEVRHVLNRLIPIRNKLSHSNTISIHEAEQCICYTGDFILAYKQHYIDVGKERDYNVPVVLRIKDSLGTDIIRDDTNYQWELHFYGHTTPKIQFRSGESYKLWLEVDSSFEPSFYSISWKVTQDYSTVIKEGTGNVIEFTLNNKNVSYAPKIYITLTSKRDWHRFHDVDDIIQLNYEPILPPIEDTY